MASQTVAPELETEGCRQWLDGRAGPQSEARGLFSLVSRGGASVEEVRELIGVSPRTESLLRAYARSHPEDARGMERVLRFRERVREEFERLCENQARSDPSE